MVSQLHIEPPHCCAAGTQNPSKISGTLTWQAGSAGRLFVTNAGGSGYTIGPARPETLGDLVDSAALSGSWCGGQRQLSVANGSLVLGSRQGFNHHSVVLGFIISKIRDRKYPYIPLGPKNGKK